MRCIVRGCLVLCQIVLYYMMARCAVCIVLYCIALRCFSSWSSFKGVVSGCAIRRWCHGVISGCEIRGWHQGVVSGGGARVWCQGVVSGGGARVWYQGVLSGGGIRVWYQCVVSGGGTKVWYQGVVSRGGALGPSSRERPDTAPPSQPLHGHRTRPPTPQPPIEASVTTPYPQPL